jgi:CBS domain containing-hemolysin-like protein
MSFALAVIFLLGNAFFVAAQFALITARRDQIEPLADEGNHRARTTLGQLRSLPRMLAGSQLGIAACSLGLGAVAEPAFAHLLEPVLEKVHAPHAVGTGVAFVVALVFVSFCHMVLGEMVPKNLALAGPVRAALVLGPPIAVWVRSTRPILAVVNGLANMIVRAFGVQPKDELGGPYTAEELADLFAQSHEEGLLDREEHQRLLAAARIERMTAGDLLIPLGRVVTISPNATVADVEALAAGTGFLRFPVRSGGRLLGYVNAKDLLALDVQQRERQLPRELIRELATVHRTARIAEVFQDVVRDGTQLCRVLDGTRTVGIVALDDMLRAVVGSTS